MSPLRALLPGLLVLALMMPGAVGQMMSIPASGSSVSNGPTGVFVDVVPETAGGSFRGGSGFLVAGADNVLNVTVKNQDKTWWNATVRLLNATGAAANAGDGSMELSVPPFSSGGALFTVHPASVGRVRLELDSGDAVLPQTGEPWTSKPEFWAVPPVAVRFVDPPAYDATVVEQDGTYHRKSTFGMQADDVSAFVRLSAGERITPRLEVENLGSATAPAFDLTLTDQQRRVGSVEVAPLEPGERREVEMPEFQPTNDDGRSGHWFPGHFSSYRLTPSATFRVGSASAEVLAADFELRNGAVAQLRPAVALVEVRSGFALDVLLPETFQLGAPTRIPYNVTSYDTQVLTGTLALTLNTPAGLYYSVQGPETKLVPLSLAPGQTKTGAFEFVPRVTGTWSIQPTFRSDMNSFGMGQTSFEVPGGVSLTLAHSGGVVFARMGEPVRVDVVVRSEETLEDARVGVASFSRSGGFRQEEASGTPQPGLAHRLLQSAGVGSSELGTLRAGGATVANLEIVSDASGSYMLVPYVEAGGFAYTSSFAFEGTPQPGVSYYNGVPSTSMLQVAVQPRMLSSAWGIMPLALGLALFVGAWTLRTRFVR